MRILFLATNPAATEASTRYRISQYLPALSAAGHEHTLSTFYGEAPTRPGGRAVRYARGLATRLATLSRASDYDVVVVHREILPFAWNHAVYGVSKETPVVFDFDDAVFLRSSGSWRPMLSGSTRLLVRRAAAVYAGNEFLASYAREINDRITVLPTVVNTDVYFPRNDREREIPVVGWIGSPSTAPYLEFILPVLDDLARDFKFRLRIVGAGRPVRMRNIEVESPPWSAATEAAAFRDLDVGLYPLPDERWVLGKCGFKAIQYMASGVASVVSPVGVARDIVRDGRDGLWAVSPAQYRQAVATLLESASLRASLAQAGRERAEDLYSLRSTAPRFLAGLATAARR